MGIKSKFTYLNETKDLLKEEISRINVVSDSDTFRSYKDKLHSGYLDILNNGTDTLWSNLEKVSQTGTEAVLEGVETAPMKMVLNGNTSQDGEPTPDTPVEVKVVTGENVVSVSGKNLFDIDNQAKIQVNAEGTLRYGIIVNAPNKKVSISGKNWSGYIAYKPLTNGVYGQWVNTNRDTTINVTDKLIIYSNGDTIKLNTYVEDLQIEISDVPTPYVPYSKTDYPISLGTIEMCKIGDNQDYLYKNSGKWYVHKEIGKVVLNGSETGWSYYPTGQYFYKTWNYPRGSAKVFIQFISNRYKNYQQQIFPSDNNKIVLVQQPDRNSEINISNHDYTTTSDFKTWLSTHNTIVYYVLATPTEEEITNTTLIEQLEAIYKAKSVKDKTFITQTNDDLPFILDVEAIKEYSVE